MHSLIENVACFVGGIVATVFFQSLVKRAFEDVLMDYEKAKARVNSVVKAAKGN